MHSNDGRTAASISSQFRAGLNISFVVWLQGNINEVWTSTNKNTTLIKNKKETLPVTLQAA